MREWEELVETLLLARWLETRVGDVRSEGCLSAEAEGRNFSIDAERGVLNCVLPRVGDLSCGDDL